MKIDDIQIEAVAKNHLWANITRDGDAFVLTDFRHPGSLRLEWDGDILWLTHSMSAVGYAGKRKVPFFLDEYAGAPRVRVSDSCWRRRGDPRYDVRGTFGEEPLTSKQEC